MVVSISQIKPQVESKFNRRVIAYKLATRENGLMTTETGLVIARRLAELEKTQEWLADQVGVSINAVSKWTKTGKISRENAIKVAHQLGLSLNVLLGAPPEPAIPEQKPLALVYVDQTELLLLTMYRESSDSGKRMIMMAAESTAKISSPPIFSTNNHKS